MADANIRNIKLTIKCDKKTYFSTRNISPLADKADLLELADAINSVQNMSMDSVIKTTEYNLLQP